MMIEAALALNLVTFPAPENTVVTINPENVVSLSTPHHGFDSDVKCILHMADGKHVAVAIDCNAVKERLQE
jgi:hypothetical protein